MEKQEGKGKYSVDVLLPLSSCPLLLLRGQASGQHSLPKTLPHSWATPHPSCVFPGTGHE